MRASLESIRFSGDDHTAVQESDELATNNSQATHRLINKLNATVARVTSRTFPSSYKLINDVAASLGIDDWDAYVFPDPSYSAYCYFLDSSSGARPVLMLSGGLVKDFREGGLRFVIGHEFGHCLLGHHGYPRPNDAFTNAHNAAVLELLRSSEFSADRVGLLASRSVNESVTAIIQLASGLTPEYIGSESADFILQNDTTIEGTWETTFEDSTHPTLPLRAINIDAFSKTNFFQELVGGIGDSITIRDCDKMVYAEISKFRGSGHAVLGGAKYAELSSFWAVTALFASDSRFSSSEQKWMSERFGERLSRGAKRFMKENGKQSTKRAMANFARFCPLIHDARQLIKDTVQADIRDAHKITDISTALSDKVLETCLKNLSL